MAKKEGRATALGQPRSTRTQRRAGAEAVTGNGGVVSLRRALDILRAIQPEDGPLSRHEIAQRTGLPNTTAARLIHTLLTLGYLSRVGAHGGYRPGPSALALGHALIEALPMRRIARPLMQRFASDFDVWVTLGTAEGGNMLVLEHAAHPRAPDIRVRSGSVLPMISTALGRAYLCAMTPNRRAEWLRGMAQRRRATGMRPCDDLAAAFAEFERFGFCTACGTWRRDILAVGTPIVMHDGGHTLALACGTTNLATNAHMLATEHGAALLRVATQIKNGLLQSGYLEDL